MDSSKMLDILLLPAVIQDMEHLTSPPKGSVKIDATLRVCYGQQTQVHFIDGILNAQRYRDEILSPLLCHSSMTITSCCSMIMHDPMLQGL